MYGAIKSAFDYLTGSTEEEDVVPRVSGLLAQHVPDQMLNDEERYFVGKVTSIHSGYALINHEIYFAIDSKLKSYKPRVGDCVNVTARRKHETGGWRATAVTPLSDWDEDEEQEAQDLVSIPTSTSLLSSLPAQNISEQKNLSVGMITALYEDYGVVNNEISFNLINIQAEYSPRVGDWVNSDLEQDTAGEVTALNVRPVRQRYFEGCVSSVQRDHGYIDKDIYFASDTCMPDYWPRRGEQVCGQAIESNRRWRATLVKPISAAEHKRMQLLSSLSQLPSPMMGKMSQSELMSDKNGVTITPDLHLDDVRVDDYGKLHATIRNNSDQPHTYLGCNFKSMSSTSPSQCRFSVVSVCREKYKGEEKKRESTSQPVVLPTRSALTVTIFCEARNLGRHQQLILFEFEGFQIGRNITINVQDPQQWALGPSGPYQRKMTTAKYREMQQGSGQRDAWIVPGQRPQRSQQSVQLPNLLPQYTVPQQLKDAVLDDQGEIENIAPVLSEPLDLSNYTKRFQALLHLEEIQQEIEIREFDIHHVGLRPFAEYLALSVPGLAEGRPSVLVGDRVILSEPDPINVAPKYEAFVHEVLRDELLLKFQDEFQQRYNGEDYNVQFFFNRTPLRRAHQAITFVPQLGKSVLFPSNLIPKVPQTKIGSSGKSQSATSTDNVVQATLKPGVRRCPLGKRRRTMSGGLAEGKTFFNTCLNTRQRTAVVRILHGQSRPTPYILFGPPGTGKTVTLVEAILQVFHEVPHSRIIASAPSNSAVDLLAERLHASGKIKLGDMVRLNAFHRELEQVPQSIQQYCLSAEELELVVHYRIVVCTCSSAGRMFTQGLRSGHFTHAFIDEAGQATEPECMIPIGLVAGSDGQVVLAGDPMQLGPVLRSKHAQRFGLGLSLLERLIHCDLYARDEVRFADHGCYDPLLVTKLVNNYRSHEVLLKLPSQIFYDDELQAAADPERVECLCTWSLLPNQNNMPLIFHGLRGEDLREGNSPSWFNAVESLQVMKYLQALVNNDVHPLTYDDIGIITPYRKQVEKIRMLIDKLGMKKVKVGSVEEFQGQERLVMIISTVRSNESYTGHDVRHNLGFLSNPKRFNVAITRGEALLIILGNPHVLAQDLYWRSLLVYCIKNGAYTGCDLPDLGMDLGEEIDDPGGEVQERIEVQSVDESELSTKQISELSSEKVESEFPFTSLGNQDDEVRDDVPKNASEMPRHPPVSAPVIGMENMVTDTVTQGISGIIKQSQGIETAVADVEITNELSAACRDTVMNIDTSTSQKLESSIACLNQTAASPSDTPDSTSIVRLDCDSDAVHISKSPTEHEISHAISTMMSSKYTDKFDQDASGEKDGNDSSSVLEADSGLGVSSEVTSTGESLSISQEKETNYVTHDLSSLSIDSCHRETNPDHMQKARKQMENNIKKLLNLTLDKDKSIAIEDTQGAINTVISQPVDSACMPASTTGPISKKLFPCDDQQSELNLSSERAQICNVSAISDNFNGCQSDTSINSSDVFDDLRDVADYLDNENSELCDADVSDMNSSMLSNLSSILGSIDTSSSNMSTSNENAAKISQENEGVTTAASPDASDVCTSVNSDSLTTESSTDASQASADTVRAAPGSFSIAKVEESADKDDESSDVSDVSAISSLSSIDDVALPAEELLLTGSDLEAVLTDDNEDVNDTDSDGDDDDGSNLTSVSSSSISPLNESGIHHKVQAPSHNVAASPPGVTPHLPDAVDSSRIGSHEGELLVSGSSAHANLEDHRVQQGDRRRVNLWRSAHGTSSSLRDALSGVMTPSTENIASLASNSARQATITSGHSNPSNCGQSNNGATMSKTEQNLPFTPPKSFGRGSLHPHVGGSPGRPGLSEALCQPNNPSRSLGRGSSLPESPPERQYQDLPYTPPMSFGRGNPLGVGRGSPVRPHSEKNTSLPKASSPPCDTEKSDRPEKPGDERAECHQGVPVNAENLSRKQLASRGRGLAFSSSKSVRQVIVREPQGPRGRGFALHRAAEEVRQKGAEKSVNGPARNKFSPSLQSGGGSTGVDPVKPVSRFTPSHPWETASFQQGRLDTGVDQSPGNSTHAEGPCVSTTPRTRVSTSTARPAVTTHHQRAKHLSTGGISSVEQAIIRQVEYYFGDFNLSKDQFLLDQMAKNDGWVPLKVLMTFNKMKELSGDASEILAALRKAPNHLIEISNDEEWLMRSEAYPLPDFSRQWMNELKLRSVYVDRVPQNAQLEQLERFFGFCGLVAHIEFLPVYNRAMRDRPFNRDVIVVFHERTGAEALLKMRTIPFGQVMLRASRRHDVHRHLYSRKRPMVHQKFWNQQNTGNADGRNEVSQSMNAAQKIPTSASQPVDDKNKESRVISRVRDNSTAKSSDNIAEVVSPGLPTNTFADNPAPRSRHCMSVQGAKEDGSKQTFSRSHANELPPRFHPKVQNNSAGDDRTENEVSSQMFSRSFEENLPPRYKQKCSGDGAGDPGNRVEHQSSESSRRNESSVRHGHCSNLSHQPKSPIEQSSQSSYLNSSMDSGFIHGHFSDLRGAWAHHQEPNSSGFELNRCPPWIAGRGQTGNVDHSPGGRSRGAPNSGQHKPKKTRSDQQNMRESSSMEGKQEMEAAKSLDRFLSLFPSFGTGASTASSVGVEASSVDGSHSSLEELYSRLGDVAEGAQSGDNLLPCTSATSPSSGSSPRSGHAGTPTNDAKHARRKLAANFSHSPTKHSAANKPGRYSHQRIVAHEKTSTSSHTPDSSDASDHYRTVKQHSDIGGSALAEGFYDSQHSGAAHGSQITRPVVQSMSGDVDSVNSYDGCHGAEFSGRYGLEQCDDDVIIESSSEDEVSDENQ